MQMHRMNIVITGHVDHGKSTLVGRLLADTNSLPQGKLESVKTSCEKSGRVFEYSMLLDALEDEQKQGITIDSARIFFKSQKREYVIIDAPGHVEFLRNMLSGASRASAAVLVIDAKEGVAENSKRHGMLLSLLGISQIIVVINKLDLFEYQQDVFENIKKEYLNFLSSLGVYPKAVVPISARTGENIATTSMLMDWYQGLSLLEELDNFSDNQNNNDSFFAMPLQDVYRFSNENDDRRIYAGTIVNGSIEIGDKILFLPSNKEATVANIEAWRSQQKSKALVNESCGLTLREEIYVRSGEVIVKKDEAENFKIKSSDKILVNLIWLGKNPLLKKKKYLFKLGCIKVKAELESVRKVIQISHDTIDSLSQDVEGLHKNEAGSIVLKLSHPIALSNFIDNQSLGRFVLVDGYDAVAGGIILDILGDLRVKNKTESFDSMEGLFEQTQSTKFEDELFDLLHRYFPHRF